jgi:general secretion pathway protein C
MPRSLVIAAELLALLVLAVIAARAIWFTAYGAYSEPFTFAQPEYRATVRETRLQPTAETFDGLFSGGVTRAPESDIDALPETQLSLRLYGVRMGSDPESGSAIVEAGANGQRTYAVGQPITDDARLAAVYADRIVISRGGAREVLFLRETDARTITPVRSGLSADTLIADLGLQAYFEAGQLIGFRVNADSSAPAVQAAGLQRGDIILEINGRALPQDGQAAARLLPQIAQANSLQLTVRRAGERITLDVSR